MEKQLILAKYDSSTSRSHMSPIWRVINDLNDIGQISYNMMIENGMNTKFWFNR
jgi:hypothetical protein